MNRQADKNHWPLYAYGLTVLFLMAASFLPELRIWGLSWYAYIGWTGRVILILVAALAWLIAGRPPKAGAKKKTARAGAEDTRFNQAAVAITLFLGLAFFLLRAKTHFLGDGYLLLTRLAEGTQVIRPWNPAAYWVQNWAYVLFGADGHESALTAFQFISLLSGFIFLAAVGLAARRLFSRLGDRLLFLLGAASGGYMLLFFGYIENYPLFVAVVAVFTLTSLLVGRKLIGRWWILLPLGLALPLHPFSVALVAPALYLLLFDTGPGRFVGGRPWWIKGPAALVLISAGVFGFYYSYINSYFFRFATIPFVENQFTIEGYTMFSLKHLVDLLNLLWVLVPAWLLLAVGAVRARPSLRRPEYVASLLLTAASIGIVFLFDPKLGMPRDWDLFSFAGVPLTLMLFTVLLDNRERVHDARKIATLAVAVGFLVLIPRAVIQATPDLALKQFDHYSALDVFKNRGGRFLVLKHLEEQGRYHEAARRRAANVATAGFERWDREGAALMRQHKFYEARDRYREIIEAYPCYPNAWTNLGLVHFQLGRFDSAIVCLEISDGLNPFSMDVYHHLALANYRTENVAEAERLWRDMIDLSPGDPQPYRYLRLMYQHEKMDRKYTDLARLILDRASSADAPLDLIRTAIEIQLERGEFDAAAQNCRRALAAGADSNYVRALEKRHPGLNVLQHNE